MAQLTDQIGTTNSGRQIIDPGPANPSFIGALADFGRQVVPGLAREGERRAQARGENALDEAAQLIHDTRLAAGREALNPQTPPVAPEYVQSGPPPIDGELAGSGLPSDAVAVGEDLARARAAVQQGRAPRASLDMRIEQSVNDLFTRFPDQRAEIAQYMQGRGFEHYMYRSELENRAIQEADAAARLGADTAPAEYAQRHGLVTSQMSLQEQAAVGRAAMIRKAQMEAQAAAAEAARQDRTLSLQEQNARQDQAAGNTIGLITEEVNAQIDPVLRNFESLFSLAGTDAERQQLLGGTQTQVLSWLAGQERSAIARIAGLGGENVNANIQSVQNMFKTYRDSMSAIVNESFTSNRRSLTNMQSWLGINSTQAAPVYSRMVSLLGSNQAVNALFANPDGTLPFPEEFRQALSQEFTNFDPTTERGTLTLARLIGFMRGEVGYKDLQANEAASYIASNSRVLRANLDRVLAGDSAAVRPWSVNYANAAEAAVELAPTTAAPSSVNRAAGQLAGPGTVRALDALVAEDPEYGRSVAQASRAGAANLMLISRQALNRASQTGPYTLQYNPDGVAGGNFEMRLTRADYDRWVQSQQRPSAPASGAIGVGAVMPPAGAPIRSYEDMVRNLPEATSQYLAAANASLTHLVNTSKFTDELPAGLTQRQMRTYYATGELPAGIVRPESGGPSGDVAFERQVREFESGLQQDIFSNAERGLPETRTALQERVLTTAREMGIDENVAFNIARIESNWNANARNTRTGAQGLFQINDDLPRDLEANIRDGLGFVKRAVDDARNALGRDPQGWEVYVAHQQGAGGGPALLNPANANRNAVEVLAPLYENRATAEQAVTNNGGRANMTVAQFLNVIRQFYER